MQHMSVVTGGRKVLLWSHRLRYSPVIENRCMSTNELYGCGKMRMP